MEQHISQIVDPGSFCFCSCCCSVTTQCGIDIVMFGHMSLSLPTFLLISHSIFQRIETTLVWHLFGVIASYMSNLLSSYSQLVLCRTTAEEIYFLIPLLPLFWLSWMLRNLKASLDFSPIVPPEVSVQAIQVPKVEMGGWKSVKKPMKENVSNKDHKEKEVSSSTEVILIFYFSLTPLLLRITVCCWLLYLGAFCCF